MHYDYDALPLHVTSTGYDVVTHDTRGKGTRVATAASLRAAQAIAVQVGGTVYGPTF